MTLYKLINLLGKTDDLTKNDKFVNKTGKAKFLEKESIPAGLQ